MIPGVSYPTPVLATIIVEEEPQYLWAIEDSTSRQDDAYWWAFIERPFSWQQVTTWWVARRFVMPRDVRRQ